MITVICYIGKIIAIFALCILMLFFYNYAVGCFENTDEDEEGDDEKSFSVMPEILTATVFTAAFILVGFLL